MTDDRPPEVGWHREIESLRLLCADGLPTVPTFAAASAEEAVRLAKAIGKPVAVPKPPRKPYSSDLTDAQWKLLEPLLPSAPGGGRPVTTDRREVVKVILSGDKNGCA